MKLLQRLALLFILIPYCLAIILYGNSVVTSDANFSNEQSKSDDKCLIFLSADLLCPTAQSENNIREFSKLPTTSPKNHFNSLIARAKAEESIILFTFSKYSFYSHNIVDRFQQTDIIFPFQYFW